MIVSSQVRSYDVYGLASSQPALPGAKPIKAVAYTGDSLQLSPAIETEDPLGPRGHWFSRADVRLGLTMAGGAAIGGLTGYSLARAGAGFSLGLGTGVGAVVGAALPLALLMYGLSRWGQ
ncbi:MAG: hypothetical protein IGS03_02425 [Candidatus Sericytochromatia bacterium]|nr:hypothetical protein [Candidatus Sericytochromatia bacterium]